VLFPASMSGESLTAAMSILATTDALILDLRHCIGGEPAAVAWLASYLFSTEPMALTGLVERGRLTQGWTLSHVPGRRFGADKPVFVLTSKATFSGGEQLSYDLQQLKRATIIGETTGGGGNARQGFRVHPHLEATISVASGLNPISGTNWEGTGVTPDVAIDSELALDHALALAVTSVAAV
jgi:C-terminal processing protease CtpA/Prc